MHQAYGEVAGAWRAMEEAQKAGKIKSLGVSNFWPAQLKNLELMMNVKPTVNQIEVNPWFQRTQEVEWNQKEDVAVEAWAPFAEGKNGIFTNKLLQQIGEKYGKTPGQVILRWLLQWNIILIPKSVLDARQKENIALFNFELSIEDMNLISTLDKNQSQFFGHHDPDTIEQIFGSSLRELRS
ncbi:Hypothetical protein SSCIU_00950 [Mammaliicoccus sciuri]|nr:Hypothetical protein SSCIU_00950 [Mammaliicoccus sciuri]